MSAGQGQRLKLIRNVAKLTIRETAQRLNVSSQHVVFLESGKRKPSELLVQQIVRTFAVNPEWIKAGRGWTYTSEDAYSLLTDLLDSAPVGTVVVLSASRKVESQPQEERGLLIELKGGVVSVRIGVVQPNNSQDSTTQSYRAILSTLADWVEGKVGRVFLSAWEADRLEQLDLSSYLKRATITRHLTDDLITISGPVAVDPALLDSISQSDSLCASLIQLAQQADTGGRATIYNLLRERYQTTLRLAEELGIVLAKFTEHDKGAPVGLEGSTTESARATEHLNEG